MSFISATNLGKTYLRGAESIKAVDGVNLNIEQGEFVSIVGPSGSGKTTLLHLLGCLDNPNAGTLQINGKDVFANGKAMPERQLTRLRAANFGYVFQKFYLIPTLTVKENILLPQVFYRKAQSPQDVMHLAQMLGLDKRLSHLPREISGGEMQRVAIARALINNPLAILADEPTGNLDSARSAEIASLLQRLNQQEGITILLVTHNPALAELANRTLELRDGILGG